MPADEVTHGADVEASRVRTGPRHAAPKKPLFTRFHVPTGKAMALAAMPTAVLMGMGFTASLAIADNNNSPSPSKSLSADEYKDCVAALEDGASASASPSPSASASESSDSDGKTDDSDGKTDDSDGKTDDTGSTPKPTATGGSSGEDSSSDSGSDDKTEPTPSPSASASKEAESSGGSATTPSPSASESGGGLLDTIGDTLEDVFTGGKKDTSDASPTPSPSASSTPATGGDSGDSGDSKGSEASDPVKETTDKVDDTVKDTVEGATDKASEAAKKAEEAAKDAADAATATPSPSASPSPDADDCPAATDAEGGIDNKVALPDDPWFLNASSLLLKGADYQGIVKVKTANGTTKEVLKYVISDGTDIGDLHQSVKDPGSGKTYHVQAGKGTTSTIRDGATVMYTEKISGNLFGLIPVTFSPESPPPLNIPLIYFTNVTVQQAGQFGGTLHVPGLHQYATG
ncbi:hypothetical protein ACFYWX_30380 [Streptomyces sp. NPDC002888]|uniref:hypothetical protein n=1 Tax=Streptomyces sp. NPDC002888 TaxID=3364668 RepID=UPI00369BC5CF